MTFLSKAEWHNPDMGLEVYANLTDQQVTIIIPSAVDLSARDARDLAAAIIAAAKSAIKRAKCT